ncbi:MAG: hypothetical protein Q7S56_03790 [Nanoarchaeota archaeon]|nr:hypothetical protein [Nanoarchaeota archaeon]
MNKKGQVTIFIIFGILVIAGILAFFLLRAKIGPSSSGSIEQNSESFLQTCIQDRVDEGINSIMKQGGYIKPEIYINWEGENVSYLCYTANYYRPCINQEPVLISHIKNDLKEYIADDFESCFADYGKTLEQENYAVQVNYKGFELELGNGKVIITSDSELIYTRSGETSKFNSFRLIIPSHLYDLATVAQEVTTQEAKYCNFENVGFGLLYPQFKVNIFKSSSLDKIYTIIYKKSNEQFKFAVRGCVIPPGF